MRQLTSAQNDKLHRFVDLLIKWNKTINLTSERSRGAIWDRHVIDSLQIAKHLPDRVTKLVDIGSGGGFPGLVLSIALDRSETDVTLVERDQRKAVFLNEARRQLGLNISVLQSDINMISPLDADVITARAFASTVSLAPILERHLSPQGVAILPKGENWQAELDEARQEWQFDCEALGSETNPRAAILKVRNLRKISNE